MRFNTLLAFLLISGGVGSSLIAGDVKVSARDQNAAAISELVVSLTPLDAELPPLPAPGSLTATVQQKNEEFDPYVIVVRTGTEVVFPNLDDVQHHVYSLSRPAKFDIPLHGGNKAESVIMDHAGLVPVGCNIHDWMLSYIVVVDSPWFAQTTETGEISLPDVPAGRYKLEAWNPRMRKAHEQEISVSASTPVVELELRLRPDRRIRRAPTANGKGY